MFAKLLRIQFRAWLLLGSVAVFAVMSTWVLTSHAMPTQLFNQIVQPLSACALAALAFVFARGHKTQVRHRAEKMYAIGAVICVWFVGYFMSGLVMTYVHNVLAANVRTVLIDMAVFGITAAAIEFTRFSTLSLVRRRDVIWFGFIVSCLFALQQMNLSGLANTHSAADVIKLAVSDFIPSIFASFLLTYLAISSGLGAQLVYRLGYIATMVLPPIIPKYDWYLIGVSSIMLSMAIYVTLNRSAQSREPGQRPRDHNRVRGAYDIMMTLVSLVLILFMSGFLYYKPSVIMSNSMLPAFAKGSMVIRQPINSAVDIHKGDIIQYVRADGTIISHRVINIDDAADGSGQRVFITKGDNNNSQDNPAVQVKQVVGIIRGSIPYVGWPTVLLHGVQVKEGLGSGA
jgi:signal peptidase I